MNQIEIAAGNLVAKIVQASVPIGEWYADYYTMLTNALNRPWSNNVTGQESNIEFFAMSLVWEISEVAKDPIHQLEEYNILAALFEEKGFTVDARKMSSTEYSDFVLEISCTCPSAISVQIFEAIAKKSRLH
ncbi:MAG: hypothetical protein JWO50_641 [Candidatus Kaiserbacteria bacterium]|nr:hypothetical protein [Candidatus Kaiserbacteria bacterium]